MVAENAPVVQVVDNILTQAVRDRASDVHIEPSQDVIYVRFRIDGALKDVLELPSTMGVGLISRIKIMAEINIVEKRRSQDGQFTTTIDGKDTDVRVATVATIWGEKCVMRILDKNRSVLRLNDLGMPVDTHETYSKLVRAPFGMVLCAGPTGSGKTTTLYATLSEVSDRARNVMTIEDPVEFVFPKINQIQTNEQAGLTFATGLKSILRQDPDVILVGEIRDVETARIAVQSALTGHFVLSSLHGNDSVSALHRFLDMGIESFLIASSVIAIVGQRLVRRICPSCKTSYTPTKEELAFYEESGGPPKTDFVIGAGCNYCGHTGYLDRIGVYELLQMTPGDQAPDCGLGHAGRAAPAGAEAGHALAARRSPQPRRPGHHDHLRGDPQRLRHVARRRALAVGAAGCRAVQRSASSHELGHRVPVPGRADHAEPALQEGAGVLGVGVAVRRVHVDLLAVDDELVAAARREAQRVQGGLRRDRGQERDVVARRVGPGLGVGARGADAPKVGDAAQEHGGRVAEVLGQALLDGGGDGRLALGRPSRRGRSRSGCTS